MARSATRAVPDLRASLAEQEFSSRSWFRSPGTRGLFSTFRITLPPLRFLHDDAGANNLAYPRAAQSHSVAVIRRPLPQSGKDRLSKRAVDIVFASLGLIAISPLMLLVSVIIRLDSPGPVIFRQLRTGLNGKHFQILKFRTMTVMEDGAVITQAKREDERVTRVGSWLRRTSVDELPQLLNVLRGEMSMVGPRPHALAHDIQYIDLITNYGRRQFMKPGITGWAQVNGLRGQTPELRDMQRRVEFDLWYIANWNLMLDFRIIFRTCIETIRARNAF